MEQQRVLSFPMALEAATITVIIIIVIIFKIIVFRPSHKCSSILATEIGDTIVDQGLRGEMFKGVQ
jgi:hypothetical protein